GCEGAGPRSAANAARPRRRGDRIRDCVAAIAHSRLWHIATLCGNAALRSLSERCRNEGTPEDCALFALGPEQLLAVNLVIGDCLLAFVRNEPVDELLAKLLLHMRMLGRVNQDDTVLVEQQFVPLHRDDEVGLVLERNPRAAVRHNIGSAACCYVERGTHALPDRFVPRPSFLLDVDA